MGDGVKVGEWARSEVIRSQRAALLDHVKRLQLAVWMSCVINTWCQADAVAKGPASARVVAEGARPHLPGRAAALHHRMHW